MNTGIILFITHLLACLTVGFLFRWWKFNNVQCNSRSLPSSVNVQCTMENNQSIKFSNIGEILSKSILNSINTLLLIGGFVVLFSILISMLKSSGTLFVLSELINPILGLFGISSDYTARNYFWYS